MNVRLTREQLAEWRGSFRAARELVYEGHLTEAGVVAVVRGLQDSIRLRRVPDEDLAEVRSFLGYCEDECIALSRDRATS